MKTVTISLDDDVYESANAEAARKRKSISEFLRDVFSSRVRSDNAHAASTDLSSLWALADAKPMTPGSVGPLNRDALYDRGLP